MRAAAQVDELTLAIYRDGLVGRNLLDDLQLEGLCALGKELESLFTGQLLAHDGQVLCCKLGHTRLDGRQVVAGQGPLVGDVIVETIFGGRTRGQLGAGKQRLDGLGQQMGCRMAQHMQALCRLIGTDRLDGSCHLHGDRRHQVIDFLAMAHPDGRGRDLNTRLRQQLGRKDGLVAGLGCHCSRFSPTRP